MSESPLRQRSNEEDEHQSEALESRKKTVPLLMAVHSTDMDPSKGGPAGVISNVGASTDKAASFKGDTTALIRGAGSIDGDKEEPAKNS